MMNFYNQAIIEYEKEFDRQPTEEACLRALDKEQLKMLLCAMLPILKLDGERFLVGTMVKPLLIKNDKLVLQTGTSFTELSVWLKKNSVMQSIKFAKIIGEYDDLDSQKAIKHLLTNQTDNDTIMKVCNRIDKDQFKFIPDIVQLLKERISSKVIQKSQIPRIARENKQLAAPNEPQTRTNSDVSPAPQQDTGKFQGSKLRRPTKV